MKEAGTFARTFALLRESPLVWVFGLALAAIGSSMLPAALAATAVRSSDNPVGRGATGAAVIAFVALAGFLFEIAAVRAIARPREGLLGALRFAAGVSPASLSFALYLVTITLVTDLVVTTTLFPLLGTALAAIVGAIFPFALNLTVIAFCTLSALALVGPVVVGAPLGLRAIALDEATSWSVWIERWFGALEHAPGRTLLVMLACLGLDAGVLATGRALAARDLAAPSLLGVVSSSHGEGVGAGIALLVLAGAAAAVKLAAWTALHERIAARAGRVASSPETAREPLARELASLVGGAARGLVGDRRVLGVAFFVALLGAASAGDLLSILGLVPRPELAASDQVTGWLQDKLGFGGLVGLRAAFAFASLLLGAGLVALTGSPACSTGEALRRGATRIPRVVGALLRVLQLVGCVGGLVFVGILFSLALVVQFAPGLDPIADQVGRAVFYLAGAVVLTVTPLASRAVLVSDLSGEKAADRAFEAAARRPLATLAVFFLSLSLDVLRGPGVVLAGAIPQGWLAAFALVHPSGLGGGVLAGSALAFVASALLVAFQAILWTRLYEGRLEDGREKWPPKTPKMRPT